jgi:hypothetical protein
MKIIKFEINIVSNFLFDLINFDPAANIGEDYSFKRGAHGQKGNDGITAFEEAVVKAAALPKEEGYRLLFATGIAKGATRITGEDRLRTLAKSNLADPDLLWGLYKEEGQKTLRYLNGTYKVKWMEALRRVLRIVPRGDHYSLYLYCRDNGSWGWDYRWLGYDRDASNPTLVLGK